MGQYGVLNTYNPFTGCSLLPEKYYWGCLDKRSKHIHDACLVAVVETAATVDVLRLRDQV